MKGSEYGFSARLMHRLALQSTASAEMSFDIDQAIFGQVENSAQAHVFVTGLARAGTTMLMRYLYESGRFKSLTYQNMPFVLMPRLWPKLSRSRGGGELRERAHKDGILVSFDSPEAFEEVFWRVFTGKQYIRNDRLLEYGGVHHDIVEKFRQYVGAITGKEGRYLSKNNNNILRLPTLLKAFPSARIIMPFREPLQHAASLLNQHRHFVKEQSGDKFVLDYMTWLGHHEFGLDQRPFFLGDEETFFKLKSFPHSSLNFWLLSWLNYYVHALNAAPPGTLFVCYEDFCRNPAEVLKLLFKELEITAPLLSPPAFTPAAKLDEDFDGGILDSCRHIHQKLKLRSIQIKS